ncbi:PREDICTED: reverse mRNAase [Prunus dulcis]|uniref:PREDICTED: reverse mRNAase n=1 Tax=Prunus dulcis TaxID=3755 RepID=A0A5E4GES4_PRUDU|nr:PREDICTED: reverse mRNAase [Prunus dulcis]
MSDLFNSRQCLQSIVDIPQLFPCIDDADVAGLVKPVDLQEVKDNLFGIGGNKAPGVDGYLACFYQNQWSLCARDIFDLVSTAFSTCIIHEKFNTTLITLVPKVPNPSSMVQFRPISLCCTLYKVISKILVARLRVILPNLISPNQVSFVLGRQIVDNIIIAQELRHKFKISKGKKGFMAWKTDLSKVYDRLNWHFIESVLVDLKLPRVFVQLVMSCISSVQYKICVNGELTDAFRPQSGIRQGDPLSPYLFVLCIEKLSHIIFDEVDKKRWKCVKSSQSGPCVSHLFFADDLVLFAEASTKQAQIMRDCLEKFCSVSGQAVNFDKSTIFCSPNTGNVLAQDLSRICFSPLTANLAGRATLIQSVTSYIPVYTMQTAKLPFFKDGWWDIERLREVLSEEMVQQIINFPAGFGGGRADAKIWKCNPNGVFTVKTAYELLVQVFEWFKAFGGTKNQEIKEQQVMSWEPPISNWLKLNVDGSRKGMSGAMTQHKQ